MRNYMLRVEALNHRRIVVYTASSGVMVKDF